jgi:hypothetical protein
MDILSRKLESIAARLCNHIDLLIFPQVPSPGKHRSVLLVSMNESVWLHIDFVGSSQDTARVLQEDRLDGEADQAADKW